MAARRRARSRGKPVRSARKRAKKVARPKARRARAKPRAARRAPAGRRAASTPAAIPSAIRATNQHVDYTSHDMDGVKRFYTETLGFSDYFTMGGNYLGVKTGATSSLGFMPPMPGPPEEWRPPREPALYFQVEDVDRAHRDLVAKGVSFDQAPADMPWGHRVCRLRDPEGRAVCLAQVLKKR